MSREIRADYDQVLLLPPSVEQWIGADHPARFIRDIVDSFDLEDLGFRSRSSAVGRPHYSADMLLKVWLYGYFSGIRSTRKLEKGCLENMGLIWLTGMNSPDHNTLWRFWKANRKSIAGVFKQSVRVAVKSELVGMVVHALDGTKIKAGSSRNKVRDQDYLERLLESLDSCVADLMTEVERNEQEEEGEFRLPSFMHDELKRKERIQKALRELESSEQGCVHLREPEARFMKNGRTKELSYNAQACADGDSGIIVAADVVNEVTDNGQLVSMLDRVKENLGEVADENVADSGYFASSEIGLAAEREYEVLVNAPSSETTGSRLPENNPYHTRWFDYDEERNICICPQGQELRYVKTRVRGKNQSRVRVFRCREYRNCPHRWDCSKNKRGREVEISVHHKELERQRIKREHPENKRLLARRKALIEPVFAWIKRHCGFRRWTVFGLERVRDQWFLVCTTINLKKLYKHWLSGGLILATG